MFEKKMKTNNKKKSAMKHVQDRTGVCVVARLDDVGE